jgi:hypothetical protein
MGEVSKYSWNQISVSCTRKRRPISGHSSRFQKCGRRTNPTPATVSAHTVHLSDSTRKKTSKGASQGRGGKEECISFLRLVASVPHADQVKGTREHARLEYTEEEACSENSRVALRKALQHSDCVRLAVILVKGTPGMAQRTQSKAKHANRQPYSRFQVFEDYVGGDLKQDVRHEEYDQGVVVAIISHQVQLF